MTSEHWTDEGEGVFKLRNAELPQACQICRKPIRPEDSIWNSPEGWAHEECG